MRHLQKKVLRKYSYPATALFEISRFFQEDAWIEIEGLAVIAADE